MSSFDGKKKNISFLMTRDEFHSGRYYNVILIHGRAVTKVTATAYKHKGFRYHGVKFKSEIVSMGVHFYSNN